MKSMKKILGFLALLAPISMSLNKLPLIQVNTNQNESSSENIFDLSKRTIIINYENSIVAFPPEEYAYDWFRKENIKIDLSWDVINGFQEAVVGKCFVHKVLPGKVRHDNLKLKKNVLYEGSKIVFYGKEQLTVPGQTSTISVTVSFCKYDLNDEVIIVAEVLVYMDAHTSSGKNECESFCSIDKVVFN